MNHTCLCLPSRSWSSFTDPGGMEGWVDLGGWQGERGREKKWGRERREGEAAHPQKFSKPAPLICEGEMSVSHCASSIQGRVGAGMVPAAAADADDEVHQRRRMHADTQYVTPWMCETVAYRPNVRHAMRAALAPIFLKSIYIGLWLSLFARMVRKNT